MRRRSKRTAPKPAPAKDPRTPPPATADEATVSAAVAPREAPPPGCQRQINPDSLRGRCACGASGPVGRSVDGIPFVNAEMLRHEPGETKE